MPIVKLQSQICEILKSLDLSDDPSGLHLTIAIQVK